MLQFFISLPPNSTQNHSLQNKLLHIATNSILALYIIIDYIIFQHFTSKKKYQAAVIMLLGTFLVVTQPSNHRLR